MLQNKQTASFFSYGNISFASFVIAAITGIFLAIPFDIKNPYDSVCLILLTNPAACLIRNLHYWSAQSFLIAAVLHIWDHLRSSSEKRIKKGVWLRLSVSIFVTFFIMLSGFILKGDFESIQAREIFKTLLESVPFLGKTLAISILGIKNDYQIIYIQHIATATVFLWLIIAEHARSFWPKLLMLLGLIPVFVVLSLIFTPPVHDNYNPVIKGPWYFLGLQEIFHWLSYPEFVIALALLLLVLLYFLPQMRSRWSSAIKGSFLILGILYVLICIFAIFFRGENWQFVFPWKDKNITGIGFRHNLSFESAFNIYNVKQIPVVLGRREGCLYCHNDVKGLSASHDPKSIGCFSCHLGDPFTLDKKAAHSQMILIPGETGTAELSCGSQNCHPDIPRRINNSIMNTMSGVISVDKYVFGETLSPSGQYKIEELSNSAAENHLRNLCASCHIGGKKGTYGPVTELSRGGGCNSCHLQYSAESLNELTRFTAEKNMGRDDINLSFHPSLTIKISNDHCFGCHSRSGRIATNFEGWHETKLNADDIQGKPGFRLLQDGRVFSRVQPDIHFEQGMSCIDCHIAKEVMGDGQFYSHKEDQVIIKCEDCHTNKLNTFKKDILDSESEKILSLRNIPGSGKTRIVYTIVGDIPILNARTDSTNKGFLFIKNSGKILPLKPPVRECAEGKAHSRLSCNSCHSAWAPQCVGCHTEYQPDQEGYDLLTNKDTKGSWYEKPGDFLAEPPVLGVKITRDRKGNKKEIIDNFVPGMILTIDQSKFNRNVLEKGTMFRRLYAPAFSHTIVKKSRSCVSCHSNSLALGYGRGELKYEIKESKGKWSFRPKYSLRKEDNIPEDAWTGFLQERKDLSVTRTNVRAFNTEEQKKILTVGACFYCHKPESFSIKKYLTSKERTVLSKKCILPLW